MFAPPLCRGSGPHSEPDSAFGLEASKGETLLAELKGAAVAAGFQLCPDSPSRIVSAGRVTSASETAWRLLAFAVPLKPMEALGTPALMYRELVDRGAEG